MPHVASIKLLCLHVPKKYTHLLHLNEIYTLFCFYWKRFCFPVRCDISIKLVWRYIMTESGLIVYDYFLFMICYSHTQRNGMIKIYWILTSHVEITRQKYSNNPTHTHILSIFSFNFFLQIGQLLVFLTKYIFEIHSIWVITCTSKDLSLQWLNNSVFIYWIAVRYIV